MSIINYISEVSKKQAQSESREHAYRPVLEDLLKSLLTDKYTVINDPAQVKGNAPDFLVKLKEVPVGYIEAKDINVDLDDQAVQEQAKRYLSAFDKLILTNYKEFRFYHIQDRADKKIKDYQRITLDTKTPEKDLEHFADVLKEFFQPTPTAIKSAKQLAEIMAHKSRIMRDVVTGILKQDGSANTDGDIQGQYAAFKKILIHDLTVEQFADMYAQTLTYGLFVARYFDKTLKNFNRHEAQDLLPPANQLLKKFFGHVAGVDFEPRLAWIIDDLIAAYAATDVHAIMHKEYERKEQDPVLHFYETYLKEYDPKLRKSRGVYYTPQPVVSFIVRSVDEILKNEFGLKDGLADTSKIEHEFKTQGIDKRTGKPKTIKKEVHRVQVLDPAAGTGTFLVEVIKQIHKRFKGQEGQWPAYVKEHLLPRLHGFELMMASYTMAHLKLGITLSESGYKDTDQRLGVYLTNALEPGVTEVPNLFTSKWLTEESAAASKVKSELPIMVVIGNPPYSGSSANETETANNLVKKYKVEPGGEQPLKERKNWLNDDYVKFIALSEKVIAENGEGLLAMITNHGYLDNPTFRGMRWHLSKTYDAIYIIDLHGNAKKKEVSPNGGKDENVFAIQQGVAIILAFKFKQSLSKKRLFHADLWGTRSAKFAMLSRSNFNTMHWQEVKLDPPFFLFVKKGDNKLQVEYEKGFSVKEFCPTSSSGIVTMGDPFIINENKAVLKKHLIKFLHNDISEEELKKQYGLGKNYAKWVVDNKSKINYEEDNFIALNYRPFDIRYTYLDKYLIWRPRLKVMQNLAGDNNNVCLIFSRSVVGGYDWHDVQVTENVTEFGIMATRVGNAASVCPLYVKDANGKMHVNMDSQIFEKIKSIVGSVAPIDVFDYIFAVLSSPKYRHKYNAILKLDYPRVPYPKDMHSFKILAKLGKELRELHLMQSPKVDEFITTYPVAGSNLVEKPTFKDGKVWINMEQYFGDVPQVAWEFYIGGYQPAQKWLKDRKGRALDADDITHYQRIIKVLVETRRVMGEIDKIFL